MPANRLILSASFAMSFAPVFAQEPTSSIRRPGEPPAAQPATIARPAGATAERLPPIGQGPPVSVPQFPPRPATTVAAAAPPPTEFNIQPSWETQKHARNFVFSIPSPRGQIVDRNGIPLAQTRMAQNLAIIFPVPSEFSDTEARAYVADRLTAVGRIIGRVVTVEPERALKHYKNRSTMPLVVSLDLKLSEIAAIERAQPPGIMLQPVYQRIYPQGKSAGHMVGYVGRQGNYPTGPVENNELLWPQVEGRAGLEASFNEQLTGKSGVMFVSYDAQGRKAQEKITVHPTPGANVISTLDMRFQKAVERSLAAAGRPCAMVVMDCNTGEILAMASTPAYDPNVFIPSISTEEYEALKNDKTKPMLPRAFQEAYPPGSVMKVFASLAAMNEGVIDADDRFGGEAFITIDGRKYWDHTKKNTGPKNFVEALTVSCNTYYYKVGMKAWKPITDYSQRLGFGTKTGIPVPAEEDGSLMTPEVVKKNHNTAMGQGHRAMLAIGQGDTAITPLQMTKAMCAVANGGSVLQPRLVLQIQGVDDKIINGYDLRVRDQLPLEKEIIKVMRQGMLGVVYGRGGTAHRAQVPGIKIAGKTGTAQWGSGDDEKVAAWFSGYAPAEKPKWAFACVYEGKPGDDSIHGGTHVGPIISRAVKEFPKDETEEKKDDKKKGGLRKKKQQAEEEKAAENNEPAAEEEAPRPRIRRRSSEPQEVVQ